jgi:dethiobiotin synthetase
MSILIVSGTGTEIGKTIVAAAVAALAAARGGGVAVVKPAQTGVAPGEAGDLETVSRLAGVRDTHEYARYPDPLSPAAAARRSGLPALSLSQAAADIRKLSEDRALVLVEGAGGLLVHLDDDGGTLADLALSLHAPLLVVAAAGLGTLNATALTCEAARRRGLDVLGVVVGDWPAQPDLAAASNLDDFPSYAGAPLLGRLPGGAGALDPTAFLEVARASLAAGLGGTWERAGAG